VNKGESAWSKFEKTVLNTPVLDRCKSKLDATSELFDEWIKDKVKVYAVDYQESNLGLSSQEKLEIFSEENIFMHIAASVNWDDPIDYTIDNNLNSTVNLLEFIRLNQTSKSDFVYISSALIFGKVKGSCFELPLGSEGTTDKRFNSKIELLKTRPVSFWSLLAKQKRLEFEEIALKTIKSPCVYERLVLEEGYSKSELIEKRRRDWVNKQLSEFGKKIALEYQFNDMYTFSKGLCEIYLENYKSDLNISIVRSSAITASIETPYVGWIERMISYNPLITKIGQGKMLVMPAKRNALLDFIPLDLVVNQICLAPLSKHLPSQQYVYNSANSSVVKHKAKEVVNSIERYFLKNPIHQKYIGKKSSYVKLIVNPRVVLNVLKMQLLIVTGIFKLIHLFTFISSIESFQKRLVFLRKKVLKNIRVLNLYSVYLEGGSWNICANTNTDYPSLLSKDELLLFNVDIKNATDWSRYWEKIHISGMMKFMINK
jgi:nucleoside-diphosphate-sugar epimerase